MNSPGTPASLIPPERSTPALSPQIMLWARAEHARAQRGIAELLEEKLDCGPQALLALLSAEFRIPAVALTELPHHEPAFDLVPYPEAMSHLCVALRAAGGETLLVLGDPYDAATQDWIEERIREPFSYRLAHRLDVLAFLARQEDRLQAMDGVVAAASDVALSVDALQELSIESISGTESTVIRLVSSTLYDALKSEASDIHLETGPSGLVIKYRIDGVLTTASTINGVEFAEQVISRIKVMSELDIAVGSSRVDLQACKLEYSIVSPK